MESNKKKSTKKNLKTKEKPNKKEFVAIDLKGQKCSSKSSQNMEEFSNNLDGYITLSAPRNAGEITEYVTEIESEAKISNSPPDDGVFLEKDLQDDFLGTQGASSVSVERKKNYLIDNFHILSKEEEIYMLKIVIQSLGKKALIVRQNKQVSINLDTIPHHLLDTLYNIVKKEKNKLSVIV